MFAYKNSYSILSKAVTLVLVCLFVTDNIVWAQLNSYSPSNSTLAIQSIFSPIINAVGIQHQKQVEFELSGIIAMALRGLKRDSGNLNKYKSFLNINSALDKRCSNPRREDKGFVERTLEVIDCPTISEDNPERPILIRIKTATNSEAQKHFKIIFKGDKLDDMFNASKIEVVEEQPSAAAPPATVKGPAVSSSASGHLYFSLVAEKGTNLEKGLKNLLLRLDMELEANGMTRNSIVKQTIFLSDYNHKTKCLEVIGKYYGRAPPATSYIIQPPLGGGIVSIEVMAVKGAKVARYENVSILEEKGTRWAYVAGIEPDNPENLTYEEKSLECFDKLKTALKSAGFGLEDIVRTWLYVSEILKTDENGGQRYQQLNDARDHFFATADSGRPIKFRSKLPVASTGIGMIGGSLVFECVAVSEGPTIEIAPLKNPRQTNPYEYSSNVLAKGARDRRAPPKFSRGMLVSTPSYKTVFVSGTASVIGEEVVNKGDAEAQTKTTIENVELVLKEGGLTLNDALQLRVYVKNKEDYEKIRSIVEMSWPGFPCLYVIGDVCRAEWMVEIETVATGVESRIPPQPSAAGPAVANESTRPKFDLNISPEVLFPIEEIRKIMRLKGENEPIKMVSDKLTEGQLDIRLITEHRVIASLTVKASNTLFMSSNNPNLEGGLKDILWKEGVSSFKDTSGMVLETERTYRNLKWRTDITHFWLNENLRGHGLGSTWYINKIEPYLQRCGFKVVSVYGTCLDLGKIQNFWEGCGFSNSQQLNQVYNGDTVLKFIFVKRLPVVPETAQEKVSPATTQQLATPREEIKPDNISISNELLLLNHISPYLRNYPVDETIDLSLIPKEDLEANMKTWAYIIALNNKHGLDVDYIFESDDESYKAAAKRMLFEKVQEIKGIDIEKVEARVTDIYRLGALQVHIMKKENLEKLKNIPENVLLIALSEGKTLDETPLRDFMSASAIGLTQAALKRMQIEKDSRLLEIIEQEILPRMQHIYQRLFPDKDIKEIVTKETILNMIDDNPIVRKNLAIALALPPIIRASIQYLKDYHEALHILQQAA